jgi:hypothetical protein
MPMFGMAHSVNFPVLPDLVSAGSSGRVAMAKIAELNCDLLATLSVGMRGRTKSPSLRFGRQSLPSQAVQQPGSSSKQKERIPTGRDIREYYCSCLVSSDSFLFLEVIKLFINLFRFSPSQTGRFGIKPNKLNNT